VSSRSDRYGTLQVLFAGAAAATAFAPFGWFPVATLSLAILFNQWLRDDRKQAFRHGLLFGAGFFGAGISWVFISIKVYGHVAAPVAIFITLGLIAFLSLYPALLGYFLVRSFRTLTSAVLLVALPAGWVLDEDGQHARRDLRVLARDGWVLVLGLVSFGTIALGLFWQTFPKGWAGVTRFAILIVVVLAAGGLVAPIITKALNRRA